MIALVVTLSFIVGVEAVAVFCAFVGSKEFIAQRKAARAERDEWRIRARAQHMILSRVVTLWGQTALEDPPQGARVFEEFAVAMQNATHHVEQWREDPA